VQFVGLAVNSGYMVIICKILAKSYNKPCCGGQEKIRGICEQKLSPRLLINLQSMSNKMAVYEGAESGVKWNGQEEEEGLSLQQN
jgi:hypothetical protein